MREFFLKVPYIGDLYIDKVYLFYDEPQVFLCLSKSFVNYFLVLINNSNTVKEWLASAVSQQYLGMIENDQVDIRSVFTDPESEVYRIIQTISGIDLVQETPARIPDVDLPLENTYLEVDNQLNGEVKVDPVLNLARSERRDVLRLSIEKNDSHSSEIGCLELSEILNSTQELFYAIANKAGSLRGSVPKVIKDKATLNVVKTFAASFGVELKSPQIGNIFNETDLTVTVLEFTELMEKSDRSDELKDYLHKSNPRVAMKYRQFLRAAVSKEIGLKIESATASEKQFYKHFTSSDLNACFSIISEEMKNIIKREHLVGQVVAVDTTNMTFKFLLNTGDKIKGSIDNQLLELVKVFQVPITAEVDVDATIGFDPFTQEEKIVYTLKSIVTTN